MLPLHSTSAMTPPIFYVLFSLSLFQATFGALTPYTGPPPSFPDRQTFGFGSSTTGGGNATNATYVVSDMPSLREALTRPFAKTVYVNGTIKGSDLFGNGTFGNCQMYIDTFNVPEFNFTLYILALNDTYTQLVEDAAAANDIFEGRNATEYLALLRLQNGWRGTAQNVQKGWEIIAITGDTTLAGWDSNAVLDGVGIQLSSVSNVILRNLKFIAPRDCFPAPETYPITWNARYKSVSVVTSANIWADGNIFEDGESSVPLEPFINGWFVDRYDGLFDAEDGSDNITFSHNIVRNHHKSMLLGGGNKEGDRDVGKMRFTFFANHFNNSDSRNPLMRFGTFHMYNNLFSSTNNKDPLFSDANSTKRAVAVDNVTATTHVFEYNLGIYNESKVLTSGNVFRQNGVVPDDVSRIFTYSDLKTPDLPATYCAHDDGFASTFNGKEVDLQSVANETLAYSMSNTDHAVEGGLVLSCDGFVEQALPKSFASAEEVEEYVLANSGQMA